MQLSNVNIILNNISLLSIEEQDFIAETLNKRIRDLKRNQLETRAKQAIKNYQTGNVQSGNVADLMQELNDD